MTAVLQNLSADVLLLDSVEAADSRIKVLRGHFPTSLGPGERLSVELAFASDRKDELFSSLVVSSQSRCTSFPLHAIATDTTLGVITQNAQVLDFGHVRAGTISDPLELLLLNQPARSGRSAPAVVEGISSTSASFQVDSMQVETPVDGCSRLSVGVRFVAPMAPGLVRGALTISVGNGELESVAAVDLLGNAD